MNSSTSIAAGSQALSYFHNRAVQYEGYEMTFGELKRSYGSDARVAAYLDGWGSYILENGMSDRDVKSAMEALADAGEGRVPHQTSVFNALGGKVGAINWIDLTKTVATETVKQVADGAQAVGHAVIDTAKSLNVILPMLVVGAVIFIVIQRSRQLAG
jgi:hypothetical protein